MAGNLSEIPADALAEASGSPWTSEPACTSEEAWNGASAHPDDELSVATRADAPELLELLRAAYEPIRQLGIQFTAVTADLPLVERIIRRHTTFILRRGGAIIGTVSVRFPWAGDESHITSYPFIHWFAVTPELKRQSIGNRILDQVEDTFLRDQVKAPAVYLATATRHPWLVGIYERRGYEGFYKHISKGDEVLYLRKILNPELYAELAEPERKRFAEATLHAEQANSTSTLR